MRTTSSIFDSGHPDSGEKEITEKIQAGRSEAIRFLGLAKKPSGRVVGRLKESGYSPPVIEAVINSLVEDGYLDDFAIAKRMMRQRQGRKGESKKALSRRMEQAGLCPEAVEKVLAKAAPDQETALELLTERFGREVLEDNTSSPENQRRTWLKLARFLAGRGYNRETVNSVLAEFLPGIDSHQEDQA